jgi:conjugative relaxase-like TrwC/TraI family protein
VLRVARVTDRGGRYYLPDLATARWSGSAAEGLGLVGRPTPHAFVSVLSGRDPRTTRPLASRRTKVAAYDLTFAAPKSASVLYGVCDEATADSVLSAHRAAVAAAVGYVAAHGATVRWGVGEERQPLPVRGVVAASFEHRLSRTLDPHVHTHVVVVNAAPGGDGRWRAVDGRGLYAHARAAGALYDAHLRHGLRAATGLEWSSRRNGAYELRCVDPTLVGAFSLRQAEIREHLHERWRPSQHPAARWADRPTGRARAVAWAVTRTAKLPATDQARLRVEWQARAEALGVDVDLRRSREAPPPTVDEHRFVAALHEKERPGAARRDVVAAWAASLSGGATAGAVDACVTSLVARGWGDGVGVGESVRTIAEVSARRHHVAALGSRPSDPLALETWRRAAAELDRYRARWQLADRPEPLGVRGSAAELSRLPARRLAEHLSVSRELDDARRRLGLTALRDAARERQGPTRLGLGLG